MLEGERMVKITKPTPSASDQPDNAAASAARKRPTGKEGRPKPTAKKKGAAASGGGGGFDFLGGP